MIRVGYKLSSQVNYIPDNIDFGLFFDDFEPTRSNKKVLNEAGLEEYNYDLYSMMRASIDFVYHAEYYFKDPNDPTQPLILEPWQKHEIRYAQFGEPYQLYYEKYLRPMELGYVPKLYNYDPDIMDSFRDDGRTRRKNIAINAPRGFGKSIFSAVTADEFALHFPYTIIALFSTSKDQAMDLMERVKYFIKTSIFNYLIDPKNNSKTEFSLLNGSRIKAFPQSEVTIRGFQPHIKIIDEKARIKQDILESAIRGMGRKTCFLEIGISTPFGMANNHYKDCMNPEVFHVHLLKPTEVRWIDDERLDSDKNIMSDRVYRQESLGEFLADADTVFSPLLLQKMFHPKLKIQETGKEDRWYVLGTDFGKHRDFSSIVIAHINSKGFIIIDRIEKYNKTNYLLIVDRIVQLCMDFNVKLIVPDGNGVGISIMENLIQKLFEQGLHTPIYKSMIKKTKDKKKRKITEEGTRTGEEIRYGFIFTNISKLNITDETLRILMNNRLKCPDHGNTKDEENPYFIFKELEDEMLGYSYTYTPSGNIIHGHQDGRHDDILMGLLLAVWGFRFLRKIKQHKKNKDKYGGIEDLVKGGRIPYRSYSSGRFNLHDMLNIDNLKRGIFYE